MTKPSVAILASAIAVCIGATLGFLAGVASMAKTYADSDAQLTRMLVTSADTLSKPLGGPKNLEEIAEGVARTADLVSTATAQAYCGLNAQQQQMARSAAARIEENRLTVVSVNRDGHHARMYMLGNNTESADGKCLPFRSQQSQLTKE